MSWNFGESLAQSEVFGEFFSYDRFAEGGFLVSSEVDLCGMHKSDDAVLVIGSMIAFVLTLQVIGIVGVVAQIDTVSLRVLALCLAVGTSNTVVCKIIVYVAVTEQLVVCTEPQGERIFILRCRRHHFPIEVLVVWSAVVTVIYLMHITISVGICQSLTLIDETWVWTAEVYTIHNELECCLCGVETAEVCIVGIVLYRIFCVIDLQLIRVAHKIPFQSLRYSLHAVPRTLIHAVVVWLTCVVNKLASVPFHLLRKHWSIYSSYL